MTTTRIATSDTTSITIRGKDLVEDLIGKLRYLHYGLAAVLAFSAIKLATARWFEIPPIVSISIITGCMVFAIGPSLRVMHRVRREARAT